MLLRATALLAPESRASSDTIQAIVTALLHIVSACQETAVAIALGGGVAQYHGRTEQGRLGGDGQ